MKIKGLASLFLLTLLSSCQLSGSSILDGSSDSSATSSEASSQPSSSESDTPYDTIYTTEYVAKYPQRSAKDVHKASYGYQGNDAQGYNGWSYQHNPNAQGWADLNYSGTLGRFETTSNFIDGPLMKAQTGAVARLFTVFPSGDGTIKISGRAHLTDKLQNEAQIQILHNSTIIFPSEGATKAIQAGDIIGHYHELTAVVSAGDRIMFIVTGSGVVNWNPTIQYDYLRETPLHYDPPGKFENNRNIDIGDVHPYYHNGKLYMFYLKTDGGYNIDLATTTNMLSYEPTYVTTHPINPPNANYYVLGITEEDGYFRTYYGASRDYIYGSKSTDLITWEAGEGVDSMFNTTHLPVVTYPTGGRDPYVFFDPDVNRYRIIYLAYYANKYWENGGEDFDCALALQTSTSDSTEYWETEEQELLRFDNAGASKRDEPEVSQMFKIGNRWYIFASIYGRSTNGVGAPSYWTGDANTKIDDVDWSSKQERFLDGEDLCAAQIVQIGNRFYIFGWIAPYANGGGWGGALNVAREIYALPDGTLATRLDSHLTNLLNGGSMYRLSDGNRSTISGSWGAGTNIITYIGDGVNNTSTGMSDYGESRLPNLYRRTLIESKITIPNGSKMAGFKLNQNGTPEYATVSIDRQNKRLIASSSGQAGYVSRATYRLPDNMDYENMEVKVIVEGAFIELFVNDEYALSARLFDDGFRAILNNYSIALFADGPGAAFEDLSINMLRTIETAYD